MNFEIPAHIPRMLFS